MHQRESHLKAYRMAHNIGAVGATFVASMEILENLAKFKWGSAAKGMISIANRKAELLKLEMSSPNLEVNYIMRANQKFGAR